MLLPNPNRCLLRRLTVVVVNASGDVGTCSASVRVAARAEAAADPVVSPCQPRSGPAGGSRATPV